MSKEKEKIKFIFPNIMAKFMKKVSMRVQLESSLMSMSMIMCGMILMVTYILIYGEVGWFYKTLIVFNLCCGFLFISSFLITTYQQYVNHMEVMGIDPEQERKEVLKRGGLLKRIRLAIREKNLKNKQSLPLEIVNEAVDRMEPIKQDELKEYKKLEDKADELQEEDLISRIEKDINSKEKEK